MNKTIDYRFKVLYAIGILMVIAGHMETGVSLTLANWFPYYGVHLPIFAFASGYFFKETATDDCLGFVKKKIVRLIIPLYLYNFVYGIIVLASKRAGFQIGEAFNLHNLLLAPILDGHQFAYNLGGWFVIPLFMVEVLYVFIRKGMKLAKARIPETATFAVFALIGITGNQLAYMGYNEGWWLVLDRMLYFLPFYALGYYYKTTLEERVSKIPGLAYFSVLFGIQGLLMLCYGKQLTFGAAWCTFKEPGVVPLLVGILGIGVWMRIASALEPVLGKNRIVNLLADNAYSIMINQFAGFMIVKAVFALLYKYAGLFPDFEMETFKTTVWYCYLPKGLPQMGIFYMIMGIVFPLCVQFVINKSVNLIRGRKNAG